MSLLEETVRSIMPVDESARTAAQARLDAKTKPRRSLGRLEDLSCRIAAICRTADPPIPDVAIAILAADHGVAEEGVSAYPQEVTRQMIENIAAGGSASQVLARHIGARLIVADMGAKVGVPALAGLLRKEPAKAGTPTHRHHSLGPGTKNFAHGPAMSHETAIRGIEIGIGLAQELIRDGAGLLAIGEMGIANTTSASAITAALTGAAPEEVTGRGTGIDDASWRRKVDVIRTALDNWRAEDFSAARPSPLATLARVGGFEIAGLVGLILGGASAKVPVILDGFITGSAALVAVGLCPAVRDYCIASHGSAEPGHRIILRELKLQPLLDLDMRLGEGTGALLAVPLVLASLRILKEMATFTAAGVTDTGA